ncbi:hypothetical protein Csa_021478 [Cucumis sativus]|nr:hypothetical protein Csa_021478 [Cucumis sativus]
MEEKWKLPKKGAPARTRSSSSSCPLMRNSSDRRCSFTRKCAKLLSSQRTPTPENCQTHQSTKQIETDEAVRIEIKPTD